MAKYLIFALLFITVVYEMPLGVCLVLSHILQKENSSRNCRISFYRAGKRDAMQNFICYSPEKLKDYLLI